MITTKTNIASLPTLHLQAPTLAGLARYPQLRAAPSGDHTANVSWVALIVQGVGSGRDKRKRVLLHRKLKFQLNGRRCGWMSDFPLDGSPLDNLFEFVLLCECRPMPALHRVYNQDPRPNRLTMLALLNYP